jgi:hypothetical protein
LHIAFSAVLTHSFGKLRNKSSAFLLSMNEVNIKYWFRYFQKKFIDFLDELWLFIEEKPICTKNNLRHSAVYPEKFGSPLLPFPFNLETSPFELVNDLVPNRSYWFLNFGNKSLTFLLHTWLLSLIKPVHTKLLIEKLSKLNII